jgi:polar amino acid transport system substrate-binding protein
MLKKFISLILILSSFSLNAYAEEKQKTIHLSTSEWPPYTGESLKDKGAHALIVKEAFAAMGYTLEIDVFPWKRTIDNAKNSPDYIGYFTVYYEDSVTEDFYYSDPVGSAPLGFVERKNNPIKWNDYNDLGKYEIGITYGYVNTPEFDKRTANGLIKTQVVNNDLTSIKRVMSGRIIAGVIDPNLLNHYIKSDPSLKDADKIIQFNSKNLGIIKHYVCFRKTPEGLKILKIFNEGLKKIDAQKIANNYFKSIS